MSSTLEGSDDVEKKLARSPRRNLGIVNYLPSFLGWGKQSVQFVDPQKSIVWLLDNTAYQPVSPNQSARQASWQVEVIACIFEKNEGNEFGEFVATVCDLIGLDGEVGGDKEVRQRIAHRLRPFVDKVVPQRLINLEISLPNSSTQTHEIGPTDESGIADQVVCTGAHYIEDRATTRTHLQGNDQVSMNTTFSTPEGWLVVSDIDDTIKHTQTSERIGILRTTFAEEPRPIVGMPELYSHVQSELLPSWFYVSASPYNLYPFLHEFLDAHYHQGTMLLRDFSWMDLGSLFKSFTKNTQEYKVDRMEKLHGWFPRRRVVCFGDSTQKDPEAYAEIYKKYPDWVQAIVIRKVTNIPNMEERNSDERFNESFKDIPDNVWKVFEKPEEVYELVNELGTRDTSYP